MSKKKKNNNTFFFSPGGYPGYSKIIFWAKHIEATDEDEWLEKVENLIPNLDVDYGCYYMSRKDVESLIKHLKKLLEE